MNQKSFASLKASQTKSDQVNDYPKKKLTNCSALYNPKRDIILRYKCCKCVTIPSFPEHYLQQKPMPSMRLIGALDNLNTANNIPVRAYRSWF